MNPEVDDLRTVARGSVRLPQRVATLYSAIARIGVGLAPAVYKYVAFIGPFHRRLDRFKGSLDPRVHRDFSRPAVLCSVEEKRFRFHVDVPPLQLKRFLRPTALKAKRQGNRLDVRCISCEKPVPFR